MSSDSVPALTKTPPRVRIYPCPTKFVFLYPTILLAFLCTLLQWWRPGTVDGAHPLGTLAQTYGHLFLFGLMLNLVVVTFEFNRGSVLAVIMGFAALVLGLLLLKVWKPDLLPWLWGLLDRINSAATPWFYFAMFLGGMAMLAGIYVQTRFDYWELTPNELIHHRGLLGDTERYSTNAMKMSKEIVDIFEYVILRSARLVVNLPTQQRPILLDNVLFVDYINRRAEDILEGGREVRADQTSVPAHTHQPPPPVGDV